jgi:dimethylargininase
MFTRAITRKPGTNFAMGLTTSSLGSPRYGLMIRQHAAYVEALRSLGLEVIELGALPDYPDAHFVEDTAVVTPRVAVVTNPGAPARRGEEETIATVLAGYRLVERIRPPGTLDGGDVLAVGNRFFIGISDRTNNEGAAQLGRILERHDHTWTAVAVGAGLHLKSSVNYLGDETLVLTGAFAELDVFAPYRKLVLDPDEAYAGNTLLINDTLIMPAGFPKTKTRLEGLKREIIELDVSEARKMDGGLTCLSLRF